MSHLRDNRIPPANKSEGREAVAVLGFPAVSTGYTGSGSWHERCKRIFHSASAARSGASVDKRNYIMPVISKFYGIVIRMLFIRPFVAHFHAIYGNWELIVGVAPLRVIQGDAPGRVRDMVLEWAAQHQDELMQAWRRLGAAQPPLPIAPLQ